MPLTRSDRERCKLVSFESNTDPCCFREFSRSIAPRTIIGDVCRSAVKRFKDFHAPEIHVLSDFLTKRK